MKKIYYLAGLLLFLAGYATNIYAQVSNENEDGVYKVEQYAAKDYVPGQVLVKFKDANRIQIRRAAGRVSSTSSNPLTELLQKYGEVDMEQLLPDENPRRAMRRSRAYNGETVQEHDLSQLYLLNIKECSNQETMQMVNDLQALDEVEFAEPNYKMYIMADDNIAADYSANPMVSQQWYLDAYGVKELWNKPIVNKTRPVIAIIDTGVDITHPDLKDNIWTKEGTTDEHGYDFINNTPKMRDSNKHGTHVAGIAAAANNGIGVVGANPRALIMPITVMQSDGTGDVATIVKGVDYAVKNGATILNLSLGTYANSSALRQALEKAYQSAVIVAAAGNDGACIYASHSPYPHKKPISMPSFPAAYSFVLGVQATTVGGGLASFSNYDDDGPLTSCESTVQEPDGFNYEMKAPGTKIFSTIPGGGYKELQGTSMASPLVAGAISALRMVKSYNTQEELWGDLLHSDNIAQAYAIVNNPAELDIVKVMLKERKELADETAEDYKSNHEVNIGETVSIYPVVRTTFGPASKIKLKIKVPYGVQIIKGEVDFGFSLDAFGRGVSINPLIVKMPDDMPNASILDCTIEATCNESDKVFTSPLELQVCNMWTLKGLITEPQTLTADQVYYVISDVGVNDDVTLTIEPGTRIEFADDAGLYGFGKIIAKGTPQKPIVFTSHNNADWAGVYSHEPEILESHSQYEGIYTNSDSTLFTLLPTEVTPNKITTLTSPHYYSNPSGENPGRAFYMSDYIDDWNPDFTCREELLTDPNYLTPGVLRMLQEWKEYIQECESKYPATSSWIDNSGVYAFFAEWLVRDKTDIFEYCRVDGHSKRSQDYTEPWFNNCIISPNGYNASRSMYTVSGFYDVLVNQGSYCYAKNLRVSNIVNDGAFIYSKDIGGNNVVNTAPYWSESFDENITTPYYLGTGREDIVRNRIRQGSSAQSYLWDKIVLGKISREPIHEAHGIVWKVLVNGKDTQDEQEELLPLGVGTNKFEVVFNRPMNKTAIPDISFGVLSPYNQHPVSEDGSWNAEGTIYTAYITIDGKTRSDGINRIYVRGAEDDEFFPCPYEATRFNIMVQAAGSMASGFQADAGLGCVNLTWNNENNDFEDAMGFNVYRYTQGENGVNDTIRINEDILDITATSFIDDNVTPGQTYYYYYKVLSTALQEYDVSNVVAATPLTATRGDANGSGSVDVADVVTTVNYVTGLQPKPFVFDAADMNSDKLIDIFDVVGIIRGILNPSLLATASLNEESAIYTIEDGTLYVDSPVTLGGVQVQLMLDGRGKMEDVSVASDLDGFETASAWLSDNDYLFLAYSMNGKTLAPGKHALLHIGNADITSLRLSDTSGKNVNVAQGGGTTGIDRMGKHVMNVEGVYDLQGRKLSTQDFELSTLKKGIYIINGKKVVK